MLQVSTVDIVVIWKFEKNRDKIPLFAWEREVIFFQLSGVSRILGFDKSLRYATNCTFKFNGKFLVRINSF